MDVGLNNKNTLGEIDPRFNDVVFFVEATNSEEFDLWREYSSESMSNIKPLKDTDIDLIIDSISDNRLRINVLDLNKSIKHIERKRVKWKQGSGFSIVIGYLDKRPINVSFMIHEINDNKVCFYHGCSELVDHKMIKDWLISRFQLTHDNYGRWNHSDANNFHNCIQGLENMDKEPRETVYKSGF